MRVLLVEDDLADVAWFERLLERDPDGRHELRIARDLEEGLETLEAWTPDAVVLDLGLPDSQGVLTVERVALAAGGVPVLVQTGLNDPELGDQVLRCGAADFIVKGRLSAEGLGRALRNAHQRHQLQVRLQRSRTTFSGIVERSRDGLLVCTHFGEVLYANPIALRYRHLQAACMEALRRAGMGNVELQLQLRNQESRTVLVGRSRTIWHDQPALLFSLRDITALREAEQRVKLQQERSQQAQQLAALGRLAGGIAHEFNNLLMVIRGHSELLADVSEDEGVLRHARQIAQAADRSTDITRQLMVFAARDDQEPQPVPVDQVVRSTSGSLRKVIGEDIELEAEVRSGPVRVNLVPGQLEQILVNLVSNAKDAIHNVGRVIVRVGTEVLDGSEFVVLEVEDDGEGMDDQTLSRAFDPFFTTKDVGEGTGLGLSAVFGIVSHAGGRMRLTSDVGAGTRVAIWLPLLDEESSLPPEPEEPLPSGPQGRRGLVLVAEDEDELRVLVEHALDHAGYDVLSVPDPASAMDLPMADLQRVEVLVSDYAMPGATGLELYQRLGKLGLSVGFVLISGYARGAEAARAHLPPEAVFLQKPFRLKALIEEVGLQVERVRAREGAERSGPPP